MNGPISIGIVGLGKIARDQHIPVIDASQHFDLSAVASRNSKPETGRAYPDLEAMLAGEPGLAAVSLCQPPQARFDAARIALESGRHVILEKPPGATMSEVEILTRIARDRGVTLFASWHSRYAAGVAAARDWIAERAVVRADIAWKEDVRHWHPGQAWIWEAGGLGVFDPGINALSIATEILPPFYLRKSSLSFPSNRETPIAADLSFRTAEGAPIEAAFDWRQTGPQTWDIRVETDRGILTLLKGGSELQIDGASQPLPPEGEYAGLYDRFAALIRAGASDVDVSPLRHVADAFLLGVRCPVEPFED